MKYTRYELKEEEIETRITDAKADGEKIGEARGIEKRKTERANGKAIEVAKKMLADGMSPELAAKYYGLSIEETEELNV